LVKREVEPGSELQLGLEFVGQQANQWLIEVEAVLKNQGLVRQWYSDFRIVIRYLLPYDPIEDGSKDIAYQLHCPRTINERLSTDKPKAIRCFTNAMYIDPRLTFRHSYITFVPQDATFVWVQCSLRFCGRREWYAWRRSSETKNAQRLFRVPSLAGATSLGAA
jgi:hypothetical protein